MIHPIRAWNRFFFQPTSAKPLGALRIGFGLLALANLAFCAVELDHWYSDAGLLQGVESSVVAGQLQLSPLHYLESPTAVRVAFGFTALAALGLTVGWRTRLMSILFYGGMLSLHHRNTVSSSGADVLLMVFTFNMMLSPCGRAFSIDAWLESRKRGTWAEPLILPWSVRLFQIQVSMVYALAVILKCGGGLWMNGTALHYVLNNAEVRRLDLSFLSSLPYYPILINLMTYSALAFEFSLAFFLWFRSTRPVVIVVGFLLHLGIMATINIPIFGELMWIGYLAFLTPPEFAAFARAIDVRRWFRRAEVEPKLEIEARIKSMPGPVAMTEPIPPRSPTIRIDGASPPIPAPHRTEPAPHPRSQTAREFAEEAMDPWDSFQILM